MRRLFLALLLLVGLLGLQPVSYGYAQKQAAELRATTQARDKAGIADLQATAKVLQENGIDVDASQLDDAHGSAMGGDADTILLGNKLTPGQALYNDAKKARFIKAAEDFAMMMVPGGSEEVAAEDVVKTAGEDAVSLVTRRGGASGVVEGALKAPDWVKDGGSFVNWMNNLQKEGRVLTKTDLDKIADMARQHQVDIRFDPPHPGTAWNVPHFNIGADGQAHIAVPSDYTPPSWVPKGSN
jgi:hypothetical protein